MLCLRANNVNEILPIALMHFQTADVIESKPRGQRRHQYPVPISSMYNHPTERVLFSSVRDCNPYFHFMESLWILAGRNDVKWLEQWLASIKDYSDDGVTFHGAYGARLKRVGQMSRVIQRLQEEKDTTRAVLAIYDAELDSGYMGKDMPCNCTVMLGIQKGRLNLTVCNRSNDMVWGAYGANVVQFSMLQEYIAGMVGCDVGWYIQISNNAHIYPDNEATQRVMEVQGYDIMRQDYYSKEDQDIYKVEPYPIGVRDNPMVWNMDLINFMNNSSSKFHCEFFREVAHPMRLSHIAYRNKHYHTAMLHASDIIAEDWKLACLQWLQRREDKRNAKVGTSER